MPQKRSFFTILPDNPEELIQLRTSESLWKLVGWASDEEIVFRIEGRSLILEPRGHQETLLLELLRGATPNKCQLD